MLVNTFFFDSDTSAEGFTGLMLKNNRRFHEMIFLCMTLLYPTGCQWKICFVYKQWYHVVCCMIIFTQVHS